MNLATVVTTGVDITNSNNEGLDIVFICGALRSGTTLLRIMVNHHPLLSNPGEMDFLFEAPPAENGAPDLARYRHEISFNRVVKSIGFKPRPELGHAGMIRDMVAQLYTGGRRLSINIHRNFSRVPAIFPGARYVHLLRDPRDVARSAIGMGWAGNAYHGVDHWMKSERDFETLAAMVPPERILNVRNEALIADPVGELTRLCAFFGVAYDPAMLTYPATTTYAAPDPSLIEQWRWQMSPRDVALVEAKIGAMLTDRGYVPSGLPPIAPGMLGRARLRVSDRWNRWRLVLRRQGPLLFLADMAARRIGAETPAIERNGGAVENGAGRGFEKPSELRRFSDHGLLTHRIRASRDSLAERPAVRFS